MHARLIRSSSRTSTTRSAWARASTGASRPVAATIAEQVEHDEPVSRRNERDDFVPQMARRRKSVDEHRGHSGTARSGGVVVQPGAGEVENIALESTRTIEIDEFVPRSEIDDLYLVRPYYIVPDGKVGHDAFAVIRETIRSLDKVALARVVLTNREHVIALEARDKGLMGMLLRYPYEVRDASEYFDDIQDVKITKDMLDLAKHIVEQKSGHFEPERFEDHYEAALAELLAKKQKGQPIAAARKAAPSNVVNLMDALRANLKKSGEAKTPAKKATKRRKAG